MGKIGKLKGQRVIGQLAMYSSEQSSLYLASCSSHLLEIVSPLLLHPSRKWFFYHFSHVVSMGAATSYKSQPHLAFERSK